MKNIWQKLKLNILYTIIYKTETYDDKNIWKKERKWQKNVEIKFLLLNIIISKILCDDKREQTIKFFKNLSVHNFKN